MQLTAETIAAATAAYLAKRTVTRVAPGYRAYRHISETGAPSEPTMRGVCITDDHGNRAIGGTERAARAALA